VNSRPMIYSIMYLENFVLGNKHTKHLKIMFS